MHPILLEIGSFQIPTYGALLVFAFVTATFLLKREAPRQGLDPEKTVDTAIAGLLFGLLGAKALLVLIDLPLYLRNPKELMSILRSAGVIYGGLIVGTLGVVWYIRRHKLDLWATVDTMAPFAALGVGLGRLSCLAAGCCYGVHYDGPLALTFPDHPHCRAEPGVPLFPIQPLAVINGIVLCMVLVAILRRKKFNGQVLVSYLFLYSVTRGLMEFLRGDDEERGYWLDGLLSTSQVIAVIGVITAVVWYQILRKRHQRG